MPFNHPIVTWIVRLILAVFVFFLLEWVLPKLLNALTLDPPQVLITVFSLLVAAVVFLRAPI